MAAEDDGRPEPVRALLAALDRTRAADLARAGDLDGAARAPTTGVAAADPSPADLDLLARIRAQQGDHADAERCWSDAATRSGHAAAFAGERRRLAEVRTGRPRSTRRPLLAVVAVLGLLVAGAAGYLVHGAGARGPDPALAELQRRQDQLSADVRALTDADRARADQARAGSDRAGSGGSDADLGPRLTAAGATVRRSPQGLQVVFPDGVFDAGTHLTAPGRSALTGVGAALAGRPGELRVVVVGQTDDRPLAPGGRYRDATELALDRAVTAARVLAPAAGMPLPAVGLAVGGPGDAPFPNGSDADRARNRTVTLDVSVVPPR